MIGFRLVNFLPPEASQKLTLSTPTGIWTLRQHADFNNFQAAIQNHQCAETYEIDHPVSMQDGSAKCDFALEEMTPILLGATYFLGLSVTSIRSIPGSECMIMQPSEHWPRERAIGVGNSILNSDAELCNALEKFVVAWPSAGRDEKALLLIHHWLDSIGCWSFEDMYLSATTILQIIAATESDRQSRSLNFFQGVSDAASRFGVPTLSADFKNMRNDLIHDGCLSGSRFANKSKNECAQVAAEVFNWFDNYLHASMHLGSPVKQRFSKLNFLSLNSYSL